MRAVMGKRDSAIGGREGSDGRGDGEGVRGEENTVPCVLLAGGHRRNFIFAR